MENSTSLMGSLYSLCDWVMRFSIINLLWVIFNLPIIIFATLIFFSGQQEGYFVFVFIAALMMPFLFFPATTAMFAAIRQWVIQGTISPLFKSYWKYYKENYKKSMFGGFIITAAWTVLIADYYYFIDKNSFLLYMLIIIGVFLFVFSMNFFSVVSHYQLNLSALLKNALLATIGNPISTLLILIGSCIILYLSFYVLLFLLPLFTGTLIAYLSFKLFYRMYLKTIEKQRIHRSK
ncbi:YesL family protein [Oceanobacillus chungangensis]|uniref:YesL family protein n=1 Tax=Oceanobacillus chungangensis TaxID=1229152 RepID=UPI0014728C88|nr:DUF624 domain-containing protein [Oceanobacillus chungangensis]